MNTHQMSLKVIVPLEASGAKQTMKLPLYSALVALMVVQMVLALVALATEAFPAGLIDVGT